MNSVCLIIPPSSFLLDERVFVSLGILKIAASIEQHGWEVDVLDLSGISNYLEVVQDYVNNSSIINYGVTATTAQMPAAAKIVKTIKIANPNANTILGGPHPTLVNAAYKREKRLGLLNRAEKAMNQLLELYDVLVAGDGEKAIFLACSSDAPRVIDADDRNSPLFLKKGTLDVEPFPARHLVDLKSYKYTIDNLPATSLVAQLGCPFECGFCAGRLSPMLRHIRTRSSENIVQEMVEIYKTYGYTGFMFYDDELNVNKDMVKLMNLIEKTQKDLKVEWRLRGFIKAELFTEEQADAMYRAGFRWVLIGFESGSPRILDTIKKKATREDNSRALAIARQYGLKIKALMSIGHPGESLETINETKNWLLSERPDDFDVTIITPYPGSPYYDEALPTEDESNWVYTASNGDKLYQKQVDYTEKADYYKGDPNDGYISHVYTDHISSEELVKERNNVEKIVREYFNIPYNQSAAAIQYDRSMGQSGILSSTGA